MPEEKWNEFEFSHESSASNSFLVVKSESGENVLEYQVSMMVNNRIERLASFEMKRKDEYVYFFYNITSKLSLSFFLKRRKLRRNEFIRILADIAETLIDCSGYLLTDSCFIIDAGYIFINPETLHISMVYVPVENFRDSGRLFRDFVVDIILNHADIDESSGDNFLQRVLTFVKSDTFSVLEFFNFLDGLLYNHESQNDLNGTIGESPADIKPERDITTGRKDMRKSFNGKSVAMALLSQILIATAVFSCRKYLASLSSNAAATYAAVVMIVIAIDILIFKNILRKRPDAEKFNPPGHTKSGVKEVIVQDHTAVKEQCRKEAAGFPAVPGNNTVLLGSTRRDFPLLRSINTSDFEEIVIDKPDFVIGRLVEQVNYVCKNNAVGKVHAQIIKRNGLFYIKDLNSINGTFINGSRIDSNKECEVKENDCIALANSEFVFILQ